MKIHESAENYLETILVLQHRKGSVRSIDIANELEFSKPSVSVAMKNLRQGGYIEVDASGLIHLLPAGRAIAEACFKSVHLDRLSCRQHQEYMKHELYMLFCIACTFARLNANAEAEAFLEQMWKNCEAHDAKWTKRFRRMGLLNLVKIPGKPGYAVIASAYKAVNKIVRFN